jgi:hypothetical protein
MPDAGDGIPEHVLGGAGVRGLAWRTGKTLSVFLDPNTAKRDFGAMVNDTWVAESALYPSGTPDDNLLPPNLATAGAYAHLIDAGMDASKLDKMGALTQLAATTGNPGAGKGTGGAGFASALGGDFEAQNNRITSTDREKIEAVLDAEYMPFYFQDLRTNEIISFHAFLGSLSDSYAVKHASTEAYGRMDPIRIYERTTRTIAMSFTVASTNPTDFDMMYFKINKLLTMIYPQWSKGTLLKGEKNTFVQPFSQIPTSSPVIRMRLGDIFRSNYTSPNLARLFGAADEDFEVEGGVGEFMKEENNGIVKSFRAVGGKGLAGVITSLNFDWYSATVWETDRFGARAPKFCKVTLNYAPIHDIAPGIDYAGINRAPVYPVGQAVRSLAGDSDPAGRTSFDTTQRAVDGVMEWNRLRKRGDKNLATTD